MKTKSNPKFVLTICHTAEYDKKFTYYSLQENSKAKAFVEAAIKATKAEKVYFWLVYARKGKGNVCSSEYTPIASFSPSGAMYEFSGPRVKLPEGLDNLKIYFR